MSFPENWSSIHCPHFGPCPGCVFQEKIDAPPLVDEVRNFFNQAGICDVPVVNGPATRWRCRAKLVVRGELDQPIVGLFKAGSHLALDIPQCQVHHRAINRAADAVRAFIRSEGIVPYNESSGDGELRYVQFVVRRQTERVQAVFVVNQKECSELWKQRLERLWRQDTALWHSLWINGNVRRDNVIFGSTWTCVQGEEWLWEGIGGVDFAFGPATFGQANLDLFERLLEDLCLKVPAESRVAEYYAGVGVIGLNLAAKGCQVKCCEIAPQAGQAYEMAAYRLGAEAANRVTFKTGQVRHFISWLQDVDVVVVDPPRKGLEPELLCALSADTGMARQLLYISCGWLAFQRDCAALLASGWRISNATIYSLFPGTDQVELLVSFER